MVNNIYFVEGECEEQLINALKKPPALIQPGRVKVFNVVQKRFSKAHLITIKPGSTVVLVFDTDVDSNTQCITENIRLLQKHCVKTKIVYLPQVLNLEDEIVRCSNINSVIELTKSRSNKDFKRDFCALTIESLRAKLDRINLNIEQLWNYRIPNEFNFIIRNSYEVKIRNHI